MSNYFGLNSIVFFPENSKVFSNSMKNNWQKQAQDRRMKFKFRCKQKKKNIKDSTGVWLLKSLKHWKYNAKHQLQRHIMGKHLNIGMKLKYTCCLWNKRIFCCGWALLISLG